MPSNVVDVQVSQIPRHRMDDNRDAGLVVQKQNEWQEETLLKINTSHNL